MNAIVSNKNQLILENLGIEIIKEMNGEFDVDEIISTFQNFFYQRMILDITAIKNYTDIRNLQKLSMALDMDKVILLLDGTDKTQNPLFLSNLVSIGIYNFAKNVEEVQYLYNSPNTYRDVAQYHQLSSGMVSPNMSIGQPQSVRTIVEVKEVPQEQVRIIGIQNITFHSGATTLTYMMKNELAKSYNVLALEVDKSDFSYFRDKSLMSIRTNQLGQIINQNKNRDVILIDLNSNMMAEGFCTEIIYLIEPSIIKLQKMMTLNSNILQTLKNKKVVLNQSLLDKEEVENFEYESRIKVFYNLQPLNERRKKLPELIGLLSKLGFNKVQ